MPKPPNRTARTHESGLYLEFPAFPGLPGWRAGFTTLKTRGGLESLLKAWGWGPTPVCRLRQVHGNRVLLLPAGMDPRDLSAEGDGLATDQRGLVLAVASADCLPLVLFDSQKKAGAVLHAGWRGTLARIAQKGVEVLQDTWDCRPPDIKAVLGPCIGICCYQVGEDVHSAFRNLGLAPSRIGESRDRSFFLDLLAINQGMLLAAGLSESNIIRANLCTHCRSDLFPSYRRDGDAAGRFFGFLASNTPS